MCNVIRPTDWEILLLLGMHSSYHGHAFCIAYAGNSANILDGRCYQVVRALTKYLCTVARTTVWPITRPPY